MCAYMSIEEYNKFARSTKSSLDCDKMNQHLAIFLFFISSTFLCPAEGYIVDSVNGNDNNDGETVNDPFQTIGRCVEALADPGDECLIRAGYYHEVVAVSGLQGKQHFV